MKINQLVKSSIALRKHQRRCCTIEYLDNVNDQIRT